MSSESTASEDLLHRARVTETVRRIQRGDAVEKQFELLFREYEPAIRRQLRYRGWLGADLDDLVQDVMLRVYRGLGRFRLDASFDTWVLQIMSNAAKNAARDRNTAKARATRTSLDGLLADDGGSGPAMAEPRAPADGPLDGALAGERKMRLAAAIEQLPERIRQCLLLRYQGYKYREIAAAQGVTVATVKKQIGQGHRRLRPILGRFVELFGAFPGVGAARLGRTSRLISAERTSHAMDWKATLEEILAERRQRLGARPSVDDFVALRAGELPPDERRRLLEHAGVDAEAARDLLSVLRFPQPCDDEDPAVDEDGVDWRWQILRRRLVAAGDLPAVAAPPVPVPRKPVWLPLAAMFLLGVVTALVAGRWRDAGAPGTTPGARVNLPIVELLALDVDAPAAGATGLRGSAETVTVAADAGGLVLALAVPRLAPSPESGPYALELTRGDGTTVTFGGLHPGAGGVFVLAVPREEWTGGVHELRLRDAGGRPVAHFELEVDLRR